MVSGFVVGHGGGALVRAFSLGYGGQAAPVVVGQVDIFQARDPVDYGPAFSFGLLWPGGLPGWWRSRFGPRL